MIRRVTAPGPFLPPARSHGPVVGAGGKPAFAAGAITATAVVPERGEGGR
ncbi:hypothetical protein GCM10017687_19240 [Streptomyces echinatus]|uniref:Uncharacterized protein n=1 Tax=Streptomyces echinatus TaxID=67293 RepID=A0A7W9Q0Z1_9ACTN|nr:hypothetical protein [Streptomyces echinatus]